MFGTKKIFAKIMNGKLVIRVGGGFMVVDEFIATYAEAEINKLNSMDKLPEDYDNVEMIRAHGFVGGTARAGSRKSGKTAGSPRAGSGRRV